ncbi:MAG: hypothetical protein ACHQU0_00795 [Candidatus Paceibacteria bacterium]
MSKKPANTLVRGMGTGMKILELLIKSAVANGADETVFSFMTRPRFQDNLDRIGKVIAECDWRIPASEMRQCAEKYYKRELDLSKMSPAELEEIRNLWWSGPCIELGIPIERFDDNPSSGVPVIPPLLASLLHGKEMTYPLVLEWGISPNKIHRKVVVNWGTGVTVFVPGDKIDTNNIQYLDFADAKYFDLDS